MEGFNFLGVADDMVSKYPWQINIDSNYINNSLIKSLVYGYPVLVNDGHLILNEILVKEISDQNSLMSTLIRNDFIFIVNRGYSKYGIDELPSKMAKKGIPTFSNLLKYGIADYSGKDYQKFLKRIHKLLEDKNYINYPKLNTGEGFFELVKLIENNTSKLNSFFKGDQNKLFHASEFIKLYKMELHTTGFSAPRTKWERLSIDYCSKYNLPESYQSTLMNLANEIYHYNFGVLIASELKRQIIVETKYNELFNDITCTHEIDLEDFLQLPRLKSPTTIYSLPTSRLLKLLDDQSELGKSRKNFIKYNSNPLELQKFNYNTQLQLLKGATEYYSEQLQLEYGSELNKNLNDKVVKFVIEYPFSYAKGLTLGMNTFQSALFAFAIFNAENTLSDYVLNKFKIIFNNDFKTSYLTNIYDHFNNNNLRKLSSSVNIDTRYAQNMTKNISSFN